MRRIAHLRIENFQSHERSELSFGPGLNVIIGPSDNGKSAVIRALRWALYNEPRGIDFVRAGARECRVTVTMSDGTAITREVLLSRSGTNPRHRYIVREPGGREQIFEAFGAEVPAEVVRAHGMPQVLLDTDKRVMLSLGTQLEGPFLLTEPGSLRARAIGRLLGVHVVDAALRATQRDLRAARQEAGRLERELARYDEELKAYADIPEEEGRLARAEALLARAEQRSQRLARLAEIRSLLEAVEAEAAQVTAHLDRLRGLTDARERLLTAEERQQQVSRLQRLAADLHQVEEDARLCRSRLAALAALDLVEARTREAAVAAERIARLQEKLTHLTELQERLAGEQEEARQAEATLHGALAEYEAVLRKLGRCPTCSQPVAAEAVPRIIADLAQGLGEGHPHE